VFRQGALALFDQAFFAGANFFVNILLARWLLPADYGQFVTLYTVMLFVGVFHSALVVDPYLVLGAGKFQSRYVDYFRVAVRFHRHMLAAAVACALLLAWTLGEFVNWEMGGRVAGVVIASSLIATLWFLRRCCYLVDQLAAAVRAMAIYCFGLLALISLFHSVDRLNVATTLVCFAVAAAVAAYYLFSALRAKTAASIVAAREISVVAEHWRLGGWGLATQLLSWIPGNIYFLVLPLVADDVANAELKALATLTMPVLHVISVIATLNMPRLVRARGTAEFDRLLKVTLALCSVLAVLNWLLLGLFGEFLIALLYHGQYAAQSHLLWLIGIAPVFSVIIAIIGTALRSLEKNRLLFFANLLAASVSVTVGVALMSLWHTEGAAIGWVLTSLLSAVVLWRVYFREVGATMRF